MCPDPPPPPRRPLALAAARRERRLATHRRVWELWREGCPGHDIARHLGIGRTTTYRYLKSEAFPERKGRSDAGRSSVDPWGEWVIARWNAGHHNGRQMLRELRERGFRGNYATVLRYLNRLRAAQGNARPHRSRARPGPPLVAAPKQVLTPRTAAWVVLRRPERKRIDVSNRNDLRVTTADLSQKVCSTVRVTVTIRIKERKRTLPIGVRHPGASGRRR